MQRWDQKLRKARKDNLEFDKKITDSVREKSNLIILL